MKSKKYREVMVKINRNINLDREMLFKDDIRNGLEILDFDRFMVE